MEEEFAEFSGGLEWAEANFRSDVVEEAEFGVADVVAVGEGVAEASGFEGGNELVFAVVHDEQVGLQVVDVLAGGDDVEVAEGFGGKTGAVGGGFLSRSALQEGVYGLTFVGKNLGIHD